MRCSGVRRIGSASAKSSAIEHTMSYKTQQANELRELSLYSLRLPHR
jgi:hypothetical protein